MVNPFGCVECRPGTCPSDKEWYTIVQVESGNEVYPGDDHLFDTFDEIEIFEPNMVFPLTDALG